MMPTPTAPNEPRRRAADQPLTVTEVATLLGVSKMTVYRLVHDRKLHARRLGRSYRVDPADLTQFLGTDCLTSPNPLLTWIDPKWVDPDPYPNG